MNSSEVLFDERLMWYKSRIQAFPGRLTITNDLIVFRQDIVRTPVGGLLGTALFQLKRKHMNDGLVLETKVRNCSYRRGRTIGKKTFILELTDDRNVLFNFLFDESLFEKFELAIKKLR